VRGAEGQPVREPTPCSRRSASGSRQLAYRSAHHRCSDEDQRDNTVNAKRQQVQILFARLSQAESWFNPELLAIPLETVRGWMKESEPLRLYTFAIENLYRQQEHVLDEAGEKLMSLSSRLAASPNDAYWALSTADAKFPTITLSTGEQVTVSYGQYRALLATAENNPIASPHPRLARDLSRHAGHAHALQLRCQRGGSGSGEGLLQHARSGPSRRQHPNVGRREPDDDEGVEALRRYHRLRRRSTGVPTYQIRLLHPARHVRQEISLRDARWIVTAIAPLGSTYQARMREGFAGRWIDVYENEGKRSGAYSAPVYGTHPYMLLNYTDTLDDVFTLAHEMGHSMNTILSHEAQPFVN
jgi:oligoendopeptidase F